MAAIDLSNVLFYKGSSSGTSAVVGNDWENDAVIRRVARYTIQAPAEGASQVSLAFTANAFGDGSYIKLRFYIGTDPGSHVNAGADAAYTGEFTMDATYLKFTADAAVRLLPNVTYYLWIVPAVDTYGWYHWPNGINSEMNADGSAGAVQICINGEMTTAIPRIYSGGEWKYPSPRVFIDGAWSGKS